MLTQSETPTQPEAGRVDGENGTNGKRILVVDDNASIRNLLTSMLDDNGFIAASAVDGLDGLRMAEAESFALVVTDIEMARMNGLEMIKLMRTQAKHEQLPILVFTASGSQVKAAIDAGADDIIIKPGQINDLINSINRLLCKSSPTPTQQLPQ